MAKLILKSGAAPERSFELKWGFNRFGRAPDNDFQIEDPTISAYHSELTLGLESVAVRDCGSTNGTSINGKRITEGVLLKGDVLRLGGVELVLEMTEANVSVPDIEAPKLPASVVLADGSLSCVKHTSVPAVWQCTECNAMVCAQCIHHLHRPGGEHHYFCPVCSGHCERVGAHGKRKKRSRVLAFLQKTLRMPVR